MKMEKKRLEGKKIRVSFKEKDLFYTIIKIIELTETHVIFFDKFNQEKMLRLVDIVEVFDNKDGGNKNV